MDDRNRDKKQLLGRLSCRYANDGSSKLQRVETHSNQPWGLNMRDLGVKKTRLRMGIVKSVTCKTPFHRLGTLKKLL